MSNIDDSIRKAAEKELSQLRGIFDATEMQNMKAAAKAMHDMYTNFVEAGFDRQQAMQLMISIIQRAFMGNAGKGNGK